MSEQTQDGTELLRLASADNFRDVAGPGYVGADGRPLRAGVFYRSNELRLSGEDLDACAALGLTTVIDLRADVEIERHPDPEIPGATWRHFDVIGIPMDEVAHLGEQALEVFEPTLVADAQYLRSAYDSVESRYGDRLGYLRDGLGLDDDVLDRLRSLLLD